MPYTDFHYTPTGTGVISGKEVLEQTEDAINDLGGQISGDVQTAIDTANNALNTANTASTDAQNAVNTANTAHTAATNAQNTANAAQTTATNAQTAAQNAQNDVNALGNRVTTAENNITQNTTDISGLTTRMGTAEGNITTLHNDVITAQGTATSAQNTATMARQQAYVLRYASTSVTPSSTISYSVLNNTDNIKAGDSVIDSAGQVFLIASVDSANQTVTVSAVLLTLALDANVMHLSGDETAAGQKSFTNTIKSQKEIEITGNRLAYILPEFSASYSGLSLCTYGSSGALKIGTWKVDDNDNTKHVLDSSLGYLNVTTGSVNGVNSVFITPRNTADSKLGDSTNKWKSINGLTPSSISLPSNTEYVDITGYFTNTGDGQTNSYTASVNGWIYLNVVATRLIMQIRNSNDNNIYADMRVRSSDGTIYMTIPIGSGNKLLTQWFTSSSVTVTTARFIPCQGNI